MDEAVPALLLAHGGYRRLVGNASRVFVAEELYVTAEWNGAQLPPRAMAVVEAEQFGTEPDGKDQHPDAAPAGDQEMAELVEKHHERQDEQKRNEIAEHAATQRVDPRQKIETH